MRINKYLAECNIGSRRKVEELVVANKVSINGKVISNLATNVDENDVVMYNGKIIKPTTNKIYLMMNKPVEYLTTVKDNEGRKTVLDIIGKTSDRIYPVGRLDYNTSGLLILTNDGDFANKLIHPSHEINKVYEVQTNVLPSKEQINQLKSGIEIDDYKTRPALISNVTKLFDGSFKLEITIHEGHNRQVRKMFEFVGLKIRALKRIQIGKLTLGNLQVGKFRKLTKQEIDLLLKN